MSKKNSNTKTKDKDSDHINHTNHTNTTTNTNNSTDNTTNSSNNKSKDKIFKDEQEKLIYYEEQNVSEDATTSRLNRRDLLQSGNEIEFKSRSSWLDHTISNAKINESEFRGVFRLILVLFIMFVSRHLYNLVFSHRDPIKKELIVRVLKDFEFLFIIWPLFHVWSYLAYFLQLLVLKGLPRWISIILQHLTQSGIFILTTIICLKGNMCSTHNIFTCIQCMVHFFKMHSYTEVNRAYRQEYLDCQKNKQKQILSSYPNNITFGNFFYFCRVPTFIYQDTYPRTDSPIDWNYVVKKFFMSGFLLLFIYYVYTEYVEIYFNVITETAIVEMITVIAIPIFLISVGGFYLVFEQVLPAYAELSKFEDRLFYDDWWNSVTMEEFNRKWNRIVHQFLYKHVYLVGIKDFGISKESSKIFTFFFSALLHEYCIVMVFGFFRPLLSVLMMFQVPLMATTSSFWKKHKSFGNCFFWASIIVGNALLFILYNREYIKIYGNKF